MMKENIEKTFQVVHFILTKLSGTSDKLRVIKLAFLADKYNLLHLSRTITGDQYFAMPRGPAGSITKDILDLDEDFISDEAVVFLEENLAYRDKKWVSVKKQVDYDLLSETDIRSIELILSKFKHMTTQQLCDYTHLLSEWHVHEEDLNRLISHGQPPSIEMDIEQMFSVPNNDFDITPAQANISKEIYFGL